uniref:Chemokine interleukin-8-like domain-containing protein n=1 Tax=Mola mola TaxID=94237 RepID=A0A3Q3WNB3_MOLML
TMTNPMRLLAALTLCCCIASMNAFSKHGCHCLWTVSKPVPLRIIRKIEMMPISGHCRWPETIITRKNGSKVCADPDDEWFKVLISRMQK